MAAKKIRKTILVASGILLVLVVLIIVFISPIVKYLVEKYDTQYTGREIKMDWAYANPFTGHVYFSNFKMYEENSDSVFISANSLSADFALRKLFSKTYEITELALDQPKGILIQGKTKHDLNINDLQERFSSKGDDSLKEPVHFNLIKLKINNGEFHYRETTIPVNYFIKKVNIESVGISWRSDTIASTFSFVSGPARGEMKGQCTVNTKKLNYALSVVVKKYDLDIIEQYLKDLSNYGSFVANMDADIKATGNFNEARVLDAKGRMAINDFHFGKNRKDDFASFKTFKLGIIKLNPEGEKYIFDTVLLDRPYFKYEMYDHLDNIQTMFGQKGSHVKEVHQNNEHFNIILEIADYVEKLAKNFFRSYYKINRLRIDNGDCRFEDYSLSEKFSASANPLFVKADSIDKNRSRAHMSFSAKLKPYGNAFVNLSINPKDSGDFDLVYNFKNLSMAAFNPYFITYTSFPLDKGSMEIKGNWRVRNSIIQSENHLIVTDPHTSKRIKNHGDKWIPVPLAMAFVRERANVIDYEIPITGDLKKPRFHWKDVIMDLLKNIFVKPPNLPYIVQLKDAEHKIEKSISLRWEMCQEKLNADQERFVKKMADFLKEYPDATLFVQPVEYTEKEKEYILFFEAKKKYLFSSRSGKLSEQDSLQVMRMSIKDSAFVRYLNKRYKRDLVFTIQEKCFDFVGKAAIDKKLEQMRKARQNEFLASFKANGTDGRLKFHEAKSVRPFNGFSLYRIDYKGNKPEELVKAFEKLQEFNEEPPRNKYQQFRERFQRLHR